MHLRKLITLLKQLSCARKYHFFHPLQSLNQSKNKIIDNGIYSYHIYFFILIKRIVWTILTVDSLAGPHFSLEYQKQNSHRLLNLPLLSISIKMDVACLFIY